MTDTESRPPRPERWLVAASEYAGLTPYTGGIGRHYAALLPALVRRGVDVDLMVVADADPLVGFDPNGVRLVSYTRMPTLVRPQALWAGARQVQRQFRREHYDRVFLPEWGALGALLPRSAPLLTNLATGLRLAYESAGLRIRDLPWRSRVHAVAQMRLESRQVRRSTGIISISSAMSDWASGHFRGLPPTRVVRNCVDVAGVREVAASAPCPESMPAGDAPIVLFLGRSERRKGIVEAFLGFGDLHARMPGVRLVVAGAGGDARFEPTRTELLALLPASARTRVTWLGHVAGDELFGAIRDSAVVMCPSRWEGFGNAALEAKAIGTPLIVTSGSGFDDFCVDGLDCLMVAPGDGAALGRALHRMLDRRDLAAHLARRAQVRAERFDPDSVAADLIAAANELLGAGEPAGSVSSPR